MAAVLQYCGSKGTSEKPKAKDKAFASDRGVCTNTAFNFGLLGLHRVYKLSKIETLTGTT